MKYFEQILDKLSYLDSGYISKVYTLDEHTVVKYGSIHDASFLYLSYCLYEAPKLPHEIRKHYPVVHRIITHKERYLCFMKRYTYKYLNALDRHQLLKYMNPFFDYLNKVGIKVESDTDIYSTLSVKDIGDWYVSGEHLRLDLHSSNTMYDPTLDIHVITDPIVGNIPHRYDHQGDLFDTIHVARYTRGKYAKAAEL